MNSAFIFTACQVGTETTLKKELEWEHPALRFAFSRPGFLTFKHSSGTFAPDFNLGSVFARAYGLSIGKAASMDEVFAAAEKLPRPLRLHVWERDLHAPGEEPKGFESGLAAQALRRQILQESRANELFVADERAVLGDSVLDVVLIEPPSMNQLWLGWHVHTADHSPFAGGMPKILLPPEAPSRAYLKIEEAALSFGIPFREGDIAVEIGSAPGGACLSLLRRGLRVVGIDPAEMDPTVGKNPDFRHIPRSVAALERGDLPERVEWLLLDMNAEPEVAIPFVSRVRKEIGDSLLGVVLTLKMNRWELAEEIPGYLERIRALGMVRLRAGQLAHNRREICVYGLTKKGALRLRSS